MNEFTSIVMDDRKSTKSMPIIEIKFGMLSILKIL